MYRVAILGCENSHANGFIKAYADRDVEIVGVYSDEREAAEKLRDKFGVPVMESYDEAVGKIDGLIVTARHGANHYKYAKPYIESGIPMFIDKPVTVDEDEAVEFMRHLKRCGVRITGGSCVPLTDHVISLKNKAEQGELGRPLGGYVRAPLNTIDKYGGFYFYSQHLVQVMCEIFGYYPLSVRMYKNGDTLTGIVRYPELDVSIQFVEHNNLYCAAVSFEKEFAGGSYQLDGCFEKEYDEFYRLLGGGDGTDYARFIAPVFVLTAMERALLGGNEETINRAGEI